jgi:hypothetical protein
MHGGQHLNVAARVEAELGGNPPGHDIDGDLASLLGVLHREMEKVIESVGSGVVPGVDAVSVGDHSRVAGLAEDLGQPHVRDRGARREQITQDLPGTD